MVSHTTAKSILDRRRLAAEEGKLSHDGPTLGEVLDSYLVRLKVKGGQVYRVNSVYARRLKKDFGASTPISKITAGIVEDIRERMIEEGKSPKTIDNYLAAARAALNSYRPVLLSNPFAEIRYFNPRNTVTDYLTREEEARLLSRAFNKDPKLYEMISISIATGFRLQNILDLRRDQFDEQGGTLTVIQKGGKSHSVPLTESIIELLRTIPPNGTRYFWVNPRTRKPFRDLRKAYYKLLKSAGIERHFRWHSLRHTTGARIMQAGLGLKATQEFLGHASIQSTLRYAHLDPSTSKRAALAASPSSVTKSVNRDFPEQEK